MDKKYTIRPGQKVTIEISPKSKVQSPKSENLIRRGAIKLKRDNPYLARRLSGNYINFYDLGYFLSGESYSTFDNIHQVLVAPSSPTDEGLEWDTSLIEETFFPDLESEIFSTSTDNFLTSFFRIPKGNLNFERCVNVAWTEGEDFIGGELQTLEQWKANGLKLSPSQVATLEIYPLTAMYNTDVLELGAMTNLKATLTRDYEAESVSFTPSNKMDVFLMPSGVFNASLSQYADGLMTGVDFSDYRLKFEVLNAQLQLLPRDVSLGQYLALLDDLGSLNDYQTKWRYAQLMKNFPDVRAKRRILEVDEVSNPTQYVYSTETFDAAGYPFAGVFDENAPGGDAETFMMQFFGFFSPYLDTEYTRLKAVIRKNNTWYYIWSTA